MQLIVHIIIKIFCVKRTIKIHEKTNFKNRRSVSSLQNLLDKFKPRNVAIQTSVDEYLEFFPIVWNIYVNQHD